VILVFVFHAAGPGLPGGFIGVDVFFVLSGYLITRILISQFSRTGRISVLDFYARRMRRLMPAVIVLVGAVVVREALWGNVLELTSRLKDGIATLFYIENWNLIAQSDQYFEESVSASPLRHAWSLSIEEQFYLIWPLLLVPILAFGRKNRALSIAVISTMVAISVVLMAALFEPGLVTRAYYGTDTRVHQPLIGALLAFLVTRNSHSTGNAPGAGYLWPTVAAVSLGGLFIASRLLTGTSPIYYLGGSFLVAVLAGVLILALERSPTQWVARSLGWNPLRQLGRISYGFYLWHWPIILWLTAPEGFSFWERRAVNLIQFLLTLAVALASFVLVESPIREGTVRVGRLKTPATIVAGLGALAVTGLFTYSMLNSGSTEMMLTEAPTSPLNSEVTPAELEGIAAAALADRSYEPCPNDPQPCVKVDGDSPESPTVVLIGDSTAQSYDPALKELAQELGFRYVQAAVGGCPLSHRLIATGTDGDLHKASNFMCYEQIPLIYETVLAEYEPDLIIATSWNETNQHVEQDRLLEKGTPEHIAATEEALRATVSLLTSDGARLVLIDVLPPGNSVECLKEGAPDTPSCVRPITDGSGETPYNQIFARLAEELDPEVVNITLTDVVCPDDVCPLIIDGQVMRYDGGHFTSAASRSLAPLLAERLLEAGVDLARIDPDPAST
jgi:peptidoglycan/LPS O-acetylase OafA/YrhL